jgi:hypothetical protein
MDSTRREAIKQAFVIPVILTLAAQPSYGSAGSTIEGEDGEDDRERQADERERER